MKKFNQSKYFITYCILALITFIVYLPSLPYPFQFDDLSNILNYTKLKSATFNNLFLAHSRWLCTWLNTLLYHFFDSKPEICRLVNILIHITNGSLIFWLCLKFKHKTIKQNYYLATITSLFFLLHPVQTQTVSYVIQGQLEGLCSFFILLTIISFWYYHQAKTIGAKILGLSFIASCLFNATSTKEIGIITPFLILLVDWFWLTTGENLVIILRQLKSKAWLYLALFSATFGIYVYYLKPAFFWKLFTGNQQLVFNSGNLLTNSDATIITQYQFFISQFKVICHYFAIFIWPFNICVEYDWQLCTSFWQPNCYVPFLGLIILVLLIFYLLKKDLRHPIAFGLIWFLICILPRSSFVASGELLVDYKTYLASFGLFFIFAYLINLLVNKCKKSKLIKTCLLILLTNLLAIFTYQRNLIWSSATNFWYDVICNAPNKARGFNNYGMAVLDSGKPGDAINYFKRAIELNKSTKIENFYWAPYQNLANAYALTNQIDLAIELIKNGLKINPNNYILNNNLGALLLHQQNYQDSIKYLNLALELKPDSGQTLYTLGKAYFTINQLEKAWLYLDKACMQTHMDRVEAACMLYAEVSIKLQKLDNAIWALKRALKINPSNINALLNLAGVYYLKQDYPASKSYYQQVLLLEPNHSFAQTKLAAIT